MAATRSYNPRTLYTSTGDTDDESSPPLSSRSSSSAFHRLRRLGAGTRPNRTDDAVSRGPQFKTTTVLVDIMNQNLEETTPPTAAVPRRPKVPIPSSFMDIMNQNEIVSTSGSTAQTPRSSIRRSAGDLKPTRPPKSPMEDDVFNASFPGSKTPVTGSGNVSVPVSSSPVTGNVSIPVSTTKAHPERRARNIKEIRPDISLSNIHSRLSKMTGYTPEVRTDKTVSRFDKSILQVLDEMSGSLAVFRQQVVTFVEKQLTTSHPVPDNELIQLQSFLSCLIPDVNRFIESSYNLTAIPENKLKQNFGKIGDVVSAVQSFSVHHLHYAPNISASDLYSWISETTHRDHLIGATRQFLDLINGIDSAVNNLINRKMAN